MNVRSVFLVAIGSGLLCLTTGADWPQWRGPNRDGKVVGFTAPKTWPKELTKKWKVPVGDGVATPSLVGDKLYVFSRQDGNEITRCLNAATGKEVWQDKYPAAGVSGPASGFTGPRCSPAVADGKVVTLGVQGTLSCLDAATGKVLWRKEDFKGFRPSFYASSSPMIVDGLCIAQLGGAENGRRGGKEEGGIVAYDLATGAEKWKWTGDTPGYASPVVDTVDGKKQIVAETNAKIVGIDAGTGKLLWETPFKVRYNAATPIVEGTTVIYSGMEGGTLAVNLTKDGKLAGDPLWKNKETSVQFNTPVLKNGFLYGITGSNMLFCMDAKTGKTTWTTSVRESAVTPSTRPAAGGAGGRQQRGGRGGRMGGSGYGSVVDAGSVLLALTPSMQLIVFEPNDKAFKKVASYKVADGATHAYPILSDKRVYIKDKDSVILWTIE